MEHLVVITIGDFSLDGHEKTEQCYVRANKSRDDVREAWFSAKERLPLCCPANFCSEYEERTIDDEHLAALREHGAPIPIDLSWVTSDDMLAITLWFLRQGDAALELAIIEAPSLMFCGPDAKGRFSDSIGYGCFG